LALKTKYIVAVVAIIVIIGTVGAYYYYTTTPAPKPEIYVGSFGGKYDEELVKGAAEFEERWNCKVILVSAPSSGELLAKARAGMIDVCHGDAESALRAENESLVTKLKLDLIPNWKNLYDKAQYTEYAVWTNVFVSGIAYHTTLCPFKPTSWYDLFRPEVKGKVYFWSSFSRFHYDLLVLFAKQKGGDERHLDAGWEQFMKLKEMDVVWLTGHADTTAAFERGEVCIGHWTNGRTYTARDNGIPVEFVYPEEGAIASVTSVFVIKPEITKRPETQDLAMRYVDWLLGETMQSLFAEELYYAPTNMNVKVSAKAAERMPYGPSLWAKLSIADYRYYISNLEDLVKKWDTQIRG
jgi:putative spermidine/putrescine transport system substrate-binding protein